MRGEKEKMSRLTCKITQGVFLSGPTSAWSNIPRQGHVCYSTGSDAIIGIFLLKGRSALFWGRSRGQANGGIWGSRSSRNISQKGKVRTEHWLIFKRRGLPQSHTWWIRADSYACLFRHKSYCAQWGLLCSVSVQECNPRSPASRG